MSNAKLASLRSWPWEIAQPCKISLKHIVESTFKKTFYSDCTARRKKIFVFFGMTTWRVSKIWHMLAKLVEVEDKSLKPLLVKFRWLASRSDGQLNIAFKRTDTLCWCERPVVWKLNAVSKIVRQWQRRGLVNFNDGTLCCCCNHYTWTCISKGSRHQCHLLAFCDWWLLAIFLNICFPLEKIPFFFLGVSSPVTWCVPPLMLLFFSADTTGDT